MDERLVFCDLETGGLDMDRHPVIQIAAIAVTAELTELESFDVKVRFDEATADPVSLKKNQYSRELWNRRGRDPNDAAHSFARFLKRHATVDLFSQQGKPYQVAQLVAHNAERFDSPFLQAWYDRLGVFLPARYIPLCTKQRALWLIEGIRPVNSILARVLIWGVESSIVTGASHGTRSGVGTELAEADAGVRAERPDDPAILRARGNRRASVFLVAIGTQAA